MRIHLLAGWRIRALKGSVFRYQNTCQLFVLTLKCAVFLASGVAAWSS